ncbi:MAG: HNH endonuclease signature motif containing protein [Chloroflexota bacterium]
MVHQRAKGLCEYCHTQERWQYIPFTIDHVIPLAEGGKNDPGNLALACFHCNRRKSSQVQVVDPVSAKRVSLYNPREDDWQKHFIWSSDGLHIVGLTPVGRATIAALDLNRERVTNIRSVDIAVDRHPPSDDPVQKA